MIGRGSDWVRYDASHACGARTPSSGLNGLVDNRASVPGNELRLDDLFAAPWVFTQTGLIEPSQFVRHARDRGVRLTEGLLELLHRRRLLTPVAQIHRRPVANPCSRVTPRFDKQR